MHAISSFAGSAVSFFILFLAVGLDAYFFFCPLEVLDPGVFAGKLVGALTGGASENDKFVATKEDESKAGAG